MGLLREWDAQRKGLSLALGLSQQKRPIPRPCFLHKSLKGIGLNVYSYRNYVLLRYRTIRVGCPQINPISSVQGSWVAPVPRFSLLCGCFKRK